LEILELIDHLEELIVQSRRLPVGGNLVVDRKRMLDLIDQLRLSVPDDIRRAAALNESRDQIVEEARQNALEIRGEAQRERERLIEQNSILQEARERAQQLIMESEERARQTIAEADATAAAHLSEAADAASRQLDDADRYALEVLTRLDAQLRTFVDSIATSLAGLQERR
jgi:vacuolar-type H+-ATPase subunit H